VYPGCRCSLWAIGWRGPAGRNAMADARGREDARRRSVLAALARRASQTAQADRWQARSPLFYTDMYTLTPGMIARGEPVDGVGERSAIEIHFTEPHVTPPPRGRAPRAQRYPDCEFQSTYFARMPDVEDLSS